MRITIMWVFGYGSLIWKADFPYEKTLVGHIKGYIRRFYQKSTDHRGTPSQPGRVVTLLSSDDQNDEVWGVAYKISTHNVDSVVKHLDYREKGGYKRKSALFYPSNSIDEIGSNSSIHGELETNDENVKTASASATEYKPFYITIYIGGEDNPNYAGIEDMNTISKHIFLSHGPSGSNIEYLYKLASAMRTIAPGVQDEHLFALEEAVKEREREESKVAKTIQS